MVSHGVSSIRPWDPMGSHVKTMGSHVKTIGTPWDSDLLPMVSHGVSSIRPRGPMGSHVKAIGTPWDSDLFSLVTVVPMGFPWENHGFMICSH